MDTKTLTVEGENVELIVPNCSKEGDHHSLAKDAVRELLANDTFLSVARHCLMCNFWVDVSHNGVPRSWSIDLTDLTPGEIVV